MMSGTEEQSWTPSSLSTGGPELEDARLTRGHAHTSSHSQKDCRMTYNPKQLWGGGCVCACVCEQTDEDVKVKVNGLFVATFVMQGLFRNVAATASCSHK